MPENSASTGNPVFDFKSGFRTRAQSIQRVLFLSGCLEIAAGIASRFVVPESAEMAQALRWAPLLGCASLVASALWGFMWRSMLRRDFQRTFGPSATPPAAAPEA